MAGLTKSFRHLSLIHTDKYTISLFPGHKAPEHICITNVTIIDNVIGGTRPVVKSQTLRMLE